MHSALAWCEHEYINQVVKFSSLRFKALRAGRTLKRRTSNIERPTSNVEIKKLEETDIRPELLNLILLETEEFIKILVTSIKAVE